MFYFIAENFKSIFGPIRLFQSYAVLILLALMGGFFITVFILPKFYKFLPKDRGKEFIPCPEASAGKPTGAGIIFISIFCFLTFLFIKPDLIRVLILLLTWLVMLTGYLDDRAANPWGEYTKGILDFILSLLTALALLFVYFNKTPSYWFPFISSSISIHPAIFLMISTIVLWISINTTNCTDGVDGLSGTLILMALVTLGVIFYFIIGHVKISEYLLVPNIRDGAIWAVLIFALCGVLMGYLWHNAFPSQVLMGDAGSRALGFFIGVMVLVSGNPFLLLMTSGVILINGGTGIFKIVLLRFFHIRIFRNIRFPLHDHMRKNLKWSPTQVLVRFMILQVLITTVVLGIIFKIR